MKLFSVLIANYNNSKYLAQALRSVQAQTWFEWEVILVDDGSSDYFSEIVSPFVSDARIRVFRNDGNHGCGYTKRKCIDLARGEIMGFLDADDALHPDALRTVIAAHLELPTHSVIHSNHFVCDASLRISRVADYMMAIPDHSQYLLLNDGRVHHFASFKRTSYLKTAGISDNLQKAVDQDLYYKLEETGPIYFIDIPLYYYRIHPNSISTVGNEKEATAWHYKVIEEACLRRLKQKRSGHGISMHRKEYRAKLIKTRIFRAYRDQAWLRLLINLILYPFCGGMTNTVEYIKKWRTQGRELLHRSFHYDHQIHA